MIKVLGVGVAVRLGVSMAAGCRFGFASNMSAIAAATCGAENDVPLAVV